MGVNGSAWLIGNSINLRLEKAGYFDVLPLRVKNSFNVKDRLTQLHELGPQEMQLVAKAFFKIFS